MPPRTPLELKQHSNMDQALIYQITQQMQQRQKQTAQQQKVTSAEAAQQQQIKLDEMADANVGEAPVTNTFSDYEPAEVTIGKPHPSAVVETTALGSQSLPSPLGKVKVCLPKDLINTGLLSRLQIETIVYATLRHSIRLPNGARSGFLLGDGPGIGKGRQIAGLVYQSFRKGNKKAMWFSASADLREDAQRDFNDIGARRFPLANITDFRPSTKLEDSGFHHGVLFSTYTSLCIRFDQILEWCGEDFDGVICFDECHKAKNFKQKDLHSDKKTGSKTAEHVVKLQRILPNARVTYVSATGASELRHVAYMDRLGIWGEGTPFRDSDHFVKTIGNQKNAALELVAMDLKSQGKYISRMLSFRGTEFKIHKITISHNFRNLYDTCCDIWVRVFQFMKRAQQLGFYDELKAAKIVPKTWNQNAIFFGASLAFYQQLCFASKVKDLVAEVKRALRDDHCVVIGLQSTGEAALNSEAKITNSSGIPSTA